MAKNEDVKIGLALSGGGFRASLFHLGVLLRLQELRVLERITHISGVSGGAIVAAAYGIALAEQENEGNGSLSTKDYEDAYEKCERILFEGIRRNPFVKWLSQKLISLLGSVFSAITPGAVWKVGNYSLRRILGGMPHIYKKLFYRDVILEALPKSVRIILNATNLDPQEEAEKERLFFFTRDYIGPDAQAAFEGPRNGYPTYRPTDDVPVTVADAVAASSAAPGAFVPYSREFFAPEAPTEVFLADGGVYDNEGFYVFLDEWAKKRPASRCKYIICSDAAGKDYGGEGQSLFSKLIWHLAPRLNTILEMIGIMKDHIRSQNFALLRNKEHQRVESLDQYAAFHVGSSSRESPWYKLPDLEDIEDITFNFPDVLKRIRTQIDFHDDIEARALMYHGYSLVNARLFTYCWRVLPEPWRSHYQALYDNHIKRKIKKEKRYPDYVRWADIIEAENGKSTPLPAPKTWQEFNRELEHRLSEYEYRVTPKGKDFGKTDLFSTDPNDKKIVVNVYKHLEYSAEVFSPLRGLNRFAERGFFANILALLVKLAVAAILVIIAVLLLAKGLNLVLPYINIARDWILTNLNLTVNRFLGWLTSAMLPSA